MEVFELIAEALTAAGAFLESISGAVTAVATLALALLTWVLARATNSMARASSSANVVANLEVNQWSFLHLDLIVQNTGNAPAFDVKVEFTPPLPLMSEVAKDDTPFGMISIVRPGQTLTSGVNDWQSVCKDIYRVKVEWKRTPTSKRVEVNAYDINLAALGKVSRFGSGSPEVQIAQQLKLLRDDWKNVALGQRKIKVEGYDNSDRQRDKEAQEEMIREFKAAKALAAETNEQQSPDT
jgi:hypothetical protein